MSTPPPTAGPADILLVEDNPGDVRLAREAFEEVDADVSLAVVSDGERALSFLRKEAEYSDVATPNLVFLDLDLPVMDGFEVLSTIKSDEQLRHLPVIILTTRDDEAAVDELYANYANAFVTKPDSVSQFIDLIGSVKSFWLTNATLPGRRPSK